MQDTTSGPGASGLDAPDGVTSGLAEALDAPSDPRSDPGPGERSGLSSRIAEELLDGMPEDLADAGAAPTAAVPDLARAVEIDDPSQAVGDDPARPIHGSFAEEFERS